MSRHRYPRRMRFTRTKRVLKEVGFWLLVALSVLFMYAFFFWGRAW